MMTEGSFYLFARRKRILTGRNVIKYKKKANKKAKRKQIRKQKEIKEGRRTVRG